MAFGGFHQIVIAAYKISALVYFIVYAIIHTQ